MSNFQKKYFYTFKDINNTGYTVEIWEDTATVLTATEIRADTAPFSIEYPAIKNKFEPVRGSGCEINLLEETDSQFAGLFTSNMLQYQVRLYNNSSALIWCGYLDSEQYHSNFTQTFNTPVQFTGSDGFALLERLNYVDATGYNFTGIQSQWQMITYILGKLNLPYNNIYVSLSTTSSELTVSASETILHKTCCFQSNFYNEDNEPETMRKVLESILSIYGAFVIQDNANIYICDINTLAKNTLASFNCYNASNYTFVNTVSLNTNIGSLNTIGFASSNSTRTIIAGINKQVIKFSPYPSTIFENTLTDDFSVAGATTQYGDSHTGYKQTEYSNSATWIKSGNGHFIRNVSNSSSTVDNYLAITPYTGESQHINVNNLSFQTYVKLPYLIAASNYKLKISISSYLEFSTNAGATSPTCDTCSMYRLHTRIWNANTICYNNKIEADFVTNFNRTNTEQETQWGLAEFANILTQTNPVYYAADFRDYTTLNTDNSLFRYNYMENKWNDYKNQRTFYTTASGSDGVIIKDSDVYIPLNMYNRDNSSLRMEIYGFVAYNKDGAIIAPQYIKELRIKDIKFTLVDLKGNEVSTADIEYVSTLDSNYKNEGSKIDNILGTSITQKPVERGGLLGNIDYTYIFSSNKYFYLSNWTRQGSTDIIENLLLRSIHGNYLQQTQQLQCSSKMLPSVFGCLNYSYLSGKNMMVTACKHNLEENSSDLTLQEINIDSLTINKT